MRSVVGGEKPDGKTGESDRHETWIGCLLVSRSSLDELDQSDQNHFSNIRRASFGISKDHASVYRYLAMALDARLR
jgi:hypothetical protein